MSSTEGVAVSALTLSSQHFLSIAALSVSPLRFLFSFIQAIGFHDLERIGRGRQHVREQRIGIERDRRNQRLELLRLQQRLVGL